MPYASRVPAVLAAALVPALATGALLAGPAEAASRCPVGGGPSQVTYPPESCQAGVSLPSPRPGEPLTVTGGGFAPGSVVTLHDSRGRVLGTGTADALGTVRITATLPADTPLGPLRLLLTGRDPSGAERELHVDVVVQAVAGRVATDPAAPSGGRLSGAGLPLTGDATGVLALGGLAALGTGSVLVVAARRRRA